MNFPENKYFSTCYYQVTSKELVSRGKQGGIKVRQYCEKQEKEAVEEEEEVEESINKLTTFNLNTRKESEQEAKSALVKTTAVFFIL